MFDALFDLLTAIASQAVGRARSTTPALILWFAAVGLTFAALVVYLAFH